MDELHIRPATAADLPAINAIYNHYVAASTCTFQLDPETDADRLAWFDSHDSAHPVTVAEAGSEVVGWGSLSRWNSRCAYARTVEFSVYVRHDQHRRGVGRALVVDLIARASTLGHHTVIGLTCTEMTASVRLQESLGFTPVGTLREVGFKFGRWLDVAYLQLVL